jgi:phosphohistidine phosphatase
MDLLIVRHAIAFERDRRRWRDDGARPLTSVGIRRARKAAAGLKKFSKVPDSLLTSPLIRAMQTAEILTEVAGWPQAVETPELSPGQPPLAVMSLLDRNGGRLVALVGHQPDLGYLLAACVLGGKGPLPMELKKNGVVCVSFDGSPGAGGGVLEWAATPRMLRGFRRRR